MAESRKYFIGIDGGKAGGITVLDSDQNIIYCEPIPLVDTAKGSTYDIKKIYSLLKKYSPNLVFFEEAHVIFGKGGIKSSFTTGELFGMIKSILVLGQFSFEIVKARQWQKRIFDGIIVKGNTKGASIEFCRNKYPKFDFTATERSKKFHTGMCDSLCISLDGLRRNIKND